MQIALYGQIWTATSANNDLGSGLAVRLLSLRYNAHSTIKWIISTFITTILEQASTTHYDITVLLFIKRSELHTHDVPKRISKVIKAADITPCMLFILISFIFTFHCEFQDTSLVRCLETDDESWIVNTFFEPDLEIQRCNRILVTFFADDTSQYKTFRPFTYWPRATDSSAISPLTSERTPPILFRLHGTFLLQRLKTRWIRHSGNLTT